MVFPLTPLDVTVELQNVVTPGTWTDVTEYVRVENGIVINRGRADEASSPEPSRCGFTVNNRDGRFSPRNPTGAYYGKIGRNTPIRVSAKLGTCRLTGAGTVSTPDSVGTSITGDIDVRVDLRMPAWAPNAVLFSKYGSAGQRSWRLYVNASGMLVLEWSTDGTATLTATSLVPVPRSTGRQAVRATLDVNNGAGGRTAVFYTAPTLSGTWTQLGDAVVQAGTTSIFDSTAVTLVNTFTDWSIYGSEVRNGIGGSVVAATPFEAQTHGAGSFVDSAGNTWTVNAGSSISNSRTRFVGEVSSWPVGWDLSEQDVWVGVEAAGIRRRLGQGAAPLRSSFYRVASNIGSSLKAYWPMEDAAGSTRFASAVAANAPMTASSSIDFAADAESFPASEALPVLNLGTAAGSFAPFSTGFCQARFFALVPSAPAVPALLASIRFGGGRLGRADLAVDTVGDLNLALYDTDGVFIAATGYVVWGVLGKTLRVSIELTQNGANLDYGIVTLEPGAPGGVSYGTTAASCTMGSASAALLGPQGTGVLGLLAETTVGHLTVQDTITPIYDLVDALDAYAGERAADRAQRLSAEEGVLLQTQGLDPATEPMGFQRPASYLDLLDEAGYSDIGIVSEDKTAARITFRTRDSLYIQHPALALDYDNLNGLVPVDDDQQVTNDVTVTRIDGSSTQLQLTSGPLSIQPPPGGVGKYDVGFEVSLETDAQTNQQASWRLNAGTLDETRYPSITLDLAKQTAAISANVLDLVEGDLVTVANPPTFAGTPDTIRQIIAGWEEALYPYGYEFAFVGIPATPYSIGVYDYAESPSRYAGDGSTLNAGITSTATGAAALSIVTPVGKPLWTSAAGDFPMKITVGGEVITLSAIAATASPQSATVSARSVNGVVKAHLAGAAVDIADPVFYAL